MSEKTLEKGKVKFLTLGCRLNQYETEAVRENFLRSGYGEALEDDQADVFVINTCTVTSDSDKTSRYLIRKCYRENPAAKIVVTGCYAERDHQTIAAIPGVTHVISNRHKADLVDLVESCTSFTFDHAEAPFRSKSQFTPLAISEFSGKTRAHVKVQDGCNHACSFCKVVLVRGKSRSRLLSDILEEAGRLAGNGYSEIVLTGIQLGAYGLDLEPKIGLKEAVRALALTDGVERIRLSSIEPVDVNDELIDALKKEKKACHHLHIPLQSGSNDILQMMNRRYARENYVSLIQKLNAAFDDFILTMDVMVGFPGETERHFQETIVTILDTKPYKLHVFPYSPREGTRAFHLTPVAKNVIEKRMSILFELEEKLRREVHAKFLGKTLRILIEETTHVEWREGRADNYLMVRIPKMDRYQTGDFLEVEIDGTHDDYLIGRDINAQ